MRPIILTTAIVLALSQPLYALASSSGIAPAKVSQQVGNVAEMQAPATMGSWQALALGREVYRDLLQARRAASHHDEIDTRLALRDASRILDSFYEPAASRALHEQMGIIREDLSHEGIKLRAGLWLPLEAELNEASLLAPPEHLAKARTALQEGRVAAAKGDRDTARERLEVMEDILGNRWGLLPLNSIRGDVHSAEMALDPEPPFWQGIDEAMQSALAAVQWVTTTNARGWFSAYEEAAHARLELPQHPGLARAALDRAGKDLDGLKNAKTLARKAHRLAAQPQPERTAIESLLQDLRAGITH